MENKEKNFVTKSIKYCSERQYKDLINAFNQNLKEEVLDITFEIFLRGGFKDV